MNLSKEMKKEQENNVEVLLSFLMRKIKCFTFNLYVRSETEKTFFYVGKRSVHKM